MDKQNVTYTYDRILSSLKTEILTQAIKWMNLEVVMLGEISQLQETNTACFQLHKAPRAVKLTDSRMVVSRDGGKGNGKGSSFILGEVRTPSGMRVL